MNLSTILLTSYMEYLEHMILKSSMMKRLRKARERTSLLILAAQDEEKVQSKYDKSNTSKQVYEEKEESSKGKLKMEEADDMTEEELEEIDEHLAFSVKKVSKLKFKRTLTMSRPTTTFRKDGQ